MFAITVAIAAPFTPSPSPGIPKNESRIKIGSSTMFTAVPAISPTIEF